MQSVCAALLVIALTWIAVGEAPLSEPPELPYNYDELPSNLPSQTSTGFINTPPTGNATAPPTSTNPQPTNNPGHTNPGQNPTNPPAASPPAATTTKAPTAPAGVLPDSANKAQAVKVYNDALARAKNASSFTAKKQETANINIHTGERIQVNYILGNLDVSVDEFFRDYVGNLRTSNYQYGDNTWSLASSRTVNDLVTNQKQNRTYMEYGTRNSVAYNDSQSYWNLSPKRGSGQSTSNLTSALRACDPLKMTSASSPESFLPPASFSANDVISHSYTKTSNGATLSFVLSSNAIKRAMIMPDERAMRAQPFVYNAIITVTMKFNALSIIWQNPQIEVTLNSDGYPTSIKQSSILANGSSCNITISSSIKTVENMKSHVTGGYNVSWTLSNWNRTTKPARPF